MLLLFAFTTPNGPNVAPVFPRTPVPGVRKLSNETPSGSLEALAASRHLSSNGTGSVLNVAYRCLSLLVGA